MAVAISTADDEYRAIATALQYGILLKRMLHNIPFIKNSLVAKGLTDNNYAISVIYSIGGKKDLILSTSGNNLYKTKSNSTK